MGNEKFKKKTTEADQSQGSSRRDFLKTGPLWVAGHFVLLNGVVFSSARSAHGKDLNCTLEQNPYKVYKDNDCGTPRGGGWPGYFEDLDCELKAGKKGKKHTDDDCGKELGLGGHYEDSSCHRLKKDNDCTLERVESGTYHHDGQCEKLATPDVSCGLKKTPDGTRHVDTDCNQIWDTNKGEVQTADSTECGVENPVTGGHFEDEDCYLNINKFFNPPKPDLDCGLENGLGGVWTDWLEYSKKTKKPK